MNKYFSLFAVVLLTTLSCFTFTSCGDDDDDNNMTQAGRAAVAVDLGLPSGTKWADRNVGASSKTDYGDCFAWGEIATKSDYSWSTYKYGSASDELSKYCTKSDYGKDGFTDNKTELVLDDDVANKLWGGSWRMPSAEQFEELINNTTNQWTTIDGKAGRLFTASNGNSVFFPAAGVSEETSLNYYAGSSGNYWSRTLHDTQSGSAYGLYFDSGFWIVDNFGRQYGHSVRPVCP